MIVCCCYGVSSEKLEGLIDDGADSLAAIAAACQAGTDCGACRSRIEGLIEDARQPSDGHCRLPMVTRAA
jgi:bacterioferritin-associated ferredoxin